MKITSTAFTNNQKIPSKYTCDGENITPPLQFADVPERTKSLALIVDDPDAPAKTWVHWVVFNINPKIKEIPEGGTPEGAQLGMTDSGQKEYHGPCPPSGIHRYFFKLYALDTTLDLPEGANKNETESKMTGHVIDSAQLVGIYKRS